MSDDQLLQPYHHIQSVPGHSFRSLLIDGVNFWINSSPDLVEIVKKIIDMLHNASLLVQDIEGHSRMSAATDAFCEEMQTMHRAQWQDIMWRDMCSYCPTETQYKEMACKKTGWLIRLAVTLLLTSGSCALDLFPLVDKFSVYYQIRDDYMNLTSPQYTENKAFCEDITEGKCSFPVIHSIQKSKPDDKLARILRQKTTDHELLRYALQLMHKTDSFCYSKHVLDEIYNNLILLLKEFDGNSVIESILERLHSTIPSPEKVLGLHKPPRLGTNIS